MHNAIDYPAAERIASALDKFEADRDVRAIVITGRHEFFCAGMDLKAFSVTGQSPILATRGGLGFVEKPSAKPLVAAVEGAALGGGLEVALVADVITVAQDARFGATQGGSGFGRGSGGGGAFRLPNGYPALP